MSLDIEGIMWGLIFFSIALPIAYAILKSSGLNKRYILFLTSFGWILYFIGGYNYYLLFIQYGMNGDSYNYFQGATPDFGVGTQFCLFFCWYLKRLLIGDSLLAAFLFSSACGFVGSVIYYKTLYILFINACNKFNIQPNKNATFMLPALIIMYWPSTIFWTAGIAKDSLCYLSLAIFMCSLFTLKNGLINKLFFVGSFSLVFILRPYLFLVIFFAGMMFIIINTTRISLFKKLFLLTILIITFIPCSDFVQSQFGMSDFSLTTIGKRAVMQQGYQAIGTHIALPTNDPHLMYLFLPYVMVANLFLPMFFGGTSFSHILDSINNLLLLILIMGYLRNKKYRNALKKNYPAIKFLFTYFICGMTMLALLNTNLGLASRHKLMYIPPLLILVTLTLMIKKIVTLNAIRNPKTC